jgi:sortase A
MAAPLIMTRPPKPRRRLRVVRAEGVSEPGRGPSVGSLFGWGTLVIGLLIFGFLGFLFGASGLQADRAQEVLYGKVVQSLAEATLPVSGPIAPGTPIGLIQIPATGTDQVLLQGSAAEQTSIAPGLRSDSVLPGQAGLSVVVGRRAAYGAPFRQLNRINPGDEIVVVTGQGKFRYVVDVVRTTDAASTKIPVVPSRLTLITSDPAFTPDRQLVVSAFLSGKPFAASTTRVSRSDEAVGQGSHGRGVAILLWSQLLLVVAVAATWAAMRFPKRAVWIGAAPVLLAVLWNVFDNLAVLLPNTL